MTQDVEHLRQLFPRPSADYDSPPQMGDDLPQHWTSEIVIDESWDTSEVFERIVKFHSIPAITKYIMSCSFLCDPDIDGWRMKNLLESNFLSSDPDNEDLKVLGTSFFFKKKENGCEREKSPVG